jgi:hypothetical protein
MMERLRIQISDVIVDVPIGRHFIGQRNVVIKIQRNAW